MRLKNLVPILACLLTFATVVPVQATTYTVTLTLTKDAETLWTGTLDLEVPDSTVNLTVPKRLYDLIVARFGTDTFTMPFEITLAVDAVIIFTLRVESDPPGLTIVFQPMSLGDVNGDRTVNIVDIVMVAIHFGATLETPNYDLFLDLNVDFQINIVDLVTIAINFGETY